MIERHVTVDLCIAAAAAVYGVSRGDVLSDTRASTPVRARFAAIWLASRMVALNNSALGRVLGDRDHATIIHGLRRAEEMRADDPGFRVDTDAMLGALEAIERNGLLQLAHTIDPVATARRVLVCPPREAVRVSVHEIVAMAELLVATFGASDEPTPSPFSETADREIEHAH